MTPSEIAQTGRIALERHRAGDLATAQALYRQILAADPNHAGALMHLGMLLYQKGENEQAHELLRRAVERSADSAAVQTTYGNVLRVLGRFEESIAAHRRAVQIDPNNAIVWNNLATALSSSGRLDEALEARRQTIRLTPHEAGFYSNLGGDLYEVGCLDEAIACLEQAVALNPDFQPAYVNLIAVHRYNPRTTPQEMLEQHVRFARRFAPSLGGSAAPHANVPNPRRRLRIGYVSGDFREHSVMRFLEPVLMHHDRAAFEVYCYSTSAVADAVTQRVRGRVPHFHSILALSDAEAAELIRAHGIDILVDLAGHTPGGRLLLFALKPAPVQVSYLGYPCTSGLEAIDYRITDERADPPGMTERFHTEALWRLPDTFLCYQPAADAPPPSPPPADAAGHITFGSFNALAKMNDQVVALWSRVLRAVPQSRLVLKSLGLASRSACARVREAYRRHGIEEQRLTLLGYIDRLADHLACYAQVDIALDTFPYNGTTTTCEALWMGVPVIALAGNAHMSRVGVSLLGGVGLGELVAADPDAYVALATELARDRTRLRSLRAGLRERLRTSPLLDAPRFTRRLEEAYRGMWVRWCEQAA